MPGQLHDEPSEVSVEDGKVLIHCSEGVTFVFTPDAAVITSDRLLRAGLAAKKQEVSGGGSLGAE